MIRPCRPLCLRRPVWLAAALLVAVAVSASAKDRVMVGDNIYVGPDEELDGAICILCSIRVDGRVREAVAILGSVHIEGEVEGDVVAILGGAKVNGTVGGDLVAVLGGADVSGSVAGDAVAVLGGLKLRSGASIGGDTVAVLGGIKRADDVEIAGDIQSSEALRPVALAAALGVLVIGLLVALAFGPVLAAITLAVLGEPRITVIRDTLNRRLGMCFLVGLAVFVGSFVLSIGLQIALFWAPGVEGLAGMAMFVVSAVGYTGLSLWVGRGLVSNGSAMGSTVLGAILITFVQLIPLLGWFLLWPIFSLLALGAAVVSGFGTSIDWLLRRAETEPIARPSAQ